MKQIITLLTLVGLILLLAGPARADQPTFIDIGGPDAFTIHRSCPFPIRYTAIRNRGKIILFDDHALISGQLFIRLTNIETGESRTYNISGPGRFDFLSGRGFNGPLVVHLRGRSFLFLQPEDIGGPIAVVTSGPIDIRSGSRRNELLSALPLNAVDVCQTLA
jgi:hypothetical protein